MELSEIVNNNERLGFDVDAVMKKYAPLASTKDKFGWGFTQSLILRAIK